MSFLKLVVSLTTWIAFLGVVSFTAASDAVPGAGAFTSWYPGHVGKKARSLQGARQGRVR